MDNKEVVLYEKIVPTVVAGLAIDGGRVKITNKKVTVKAFWFIKLFDMKLSRVKQIKLVEGNFGINPTVKVKYDENKTVVFMFFKEESAKELVTILKKAVKDNINSISHNSV